MDTDEFRSVFVFVSPFSERVVCGDGFSITLTVSDGGGGICCFVCPLDAVDEEEDCDEEEDDDEDSSSYLRNTSPTWRDFLFRLPCVCLWCLPCFPWWCLCLCFGCGELFTAVTGGTTAVSSDCAGGGGRAGVFALIAFGSGAFVGALTPVEAEAATE